MNELNFKNVIEVGVVGSDILTRPRRLSDTRPARGSGDNREKPWTALNNQENSMKVMLQMLTIGLAALLTVGCGSSPEPAGSVPANMQGIQFPDWVLKGSGAFPGDDGKQVFYGVGSVSGIKNHSLARSTADNRARAEIQKTFETYSASLMKDYMSSTAAGDMTASDEQQFVESATKTFSAGTLSGVVIADHWYHPDGTVYALAKLDLERFKDSVSKMKDLSAAVRDYVQQNAQRAFDGLDAEEAKRQ